MALRPVTVVAAVCDECGWVALQAGDDRRGAGYRAGRAGWQTFDDSDLAYCPDHWHVKCEQCDREASGSETGLLKAGWRCIDCRSGRALCPDHAKEWRTVWR
jgi:hypothetical protein